MITLHMMSIWGLLEKSGSRQLRTSSLGGKNGSDVSALYHVMEYERERLKPFRRALSKEDQEAFDRLFDRARMLTSAGVYMANPWPMETILLSTCLVTGKIAKGLWAFSN